MNIFYLLFAYLCDAVENKSCRDTVGYTVTKSHKDSCEKRRDSLVEIIPFDFFERGHHHDSDYDQSGSGRGIRHGAHKSSQKRADNKAQGNHNAGKTGTSSGAYSGGAFNISRSVGRSEDSPDRSSSSVGEQSLVHFGFEPGISLHSLLVLVAEYAGAGGLFR